MGLRGQLWFSNGGTGSWTVTLDLRQCSWFPVSGNRYQTVASLLIWLPSVPKRWMWLPRRRYLFASVGTGFQAVALISRWQDWSLDGAIDSRWCNWFHANGVCFHMIVLVPSRWHWFQRWHFPEGSVEFLLVALVSNGDNCSKRAELNSSH